LLGATRYGLPLAIHTQWATVFALVAQQNSSPLAFLQMSSRLWVVGPPTHSCDTGVTWRPLFYFTCIAYTARIQVVHPEASSVIGIATWGKPTSSSVGWAIPIALGFIRPLHCPSPRRAVDSPSTPSVHPVDYRLDSCSYLPCDCRHPQDGNTRVTSHMGVSSWGQQVATC